MNRRGRRDNEARINIGMVLWGAIIAVAIVAFIVSYFLYSNKLEKQAKEIIVDIFAPGCAGEAAQERGVLDGEIGEELRVVVY